MKSLLSPAFDVAHVMSICNRKVAAILRAKFAGSMDAFQRLELQYVAAGTGGGLASFAATLDTTGILTTPVESQGLYLVRMVPERSSGRYLYEAIRDSDGGVCALCNIREATTVDHYLPKELYPALSFLPMNLLPACARCNGYKLTYSPSSRLDELLHPYFDDVASRQWISAEVHEGNPVPRYRVLYLDDDGETSVRIGGHFARFRLQEAYGRYAANELGSLSETVTAYFGTAASPESVRNYLTIRANSYAKAYSRNHWQAVTYKAWAQSRWFVSGGHTSIRSSQ